jgi:ABC-2 type transport system ATP-binding protein
LPTSGRAVVAGHDVVTDTAAVRRVIGIVFGGERGLYTRLTAKQNLAFWAALYGMRGQALRTRVDELLDRMGPGRTRRATGGRVQPRHEAAAASGPWAGR